MSEILHISQLHKRFGKNHVLRGLDLSLDRGKVHGLLGKNGEGKTTLIRIITGVIPADAGTIQVNGRPIRYSDASYKTDIGYIPEDPFFYENLKIGEFLAYNALFYPSWDARKAGAYLDRFSLNPKAPISALSRGMKLKLGFVTALSANPSLLILDDPTSGLDVPTRQDFLKDIIRELADGGTTVLFSTHLVHELERIVDRVHILKAGRIVVSDDYEHMKAETGQAGLEAIFMAYVA
jgi:ABC-2 type transport system ATP-binding protein